MRDGAVLLRLLDEKLDALADPLDPGFGFDLIRLDARLAEKSQSAAVSFDEDENAKWQVRFLIDRLSARFGEHRVQRFVPQDTHIPEAAAVAVPAQEDDFDGTWKRTNQNDPPRRPLRLLQQPEPIKQGLPTAPDGAPAFFQWRQCRHEVAYAEGPERIAMEWWKNSEPTRDYFRIETRQGLRFWIYRDGSYRQDGLNPRWYLQGIFA